MTLLHWILLLVGGYLLTNFTIALLLHRHADRQAHLPVPRLDIVVHFLLLTLFALPVVVVILWEAVFGREPQARVTASAPLGARAA